MFQKELSLEQQEKIDILADILLHNPIGRDFINLLLGDIEPKVEHPSKSLQTDVARSAVLLSFDMKGTHPEWDELPHEEKRRQVHSAIRTRLQELQPFKGRC